MTEKDRKVYIKIEWGQKIDIYIIVADSPSQPITGKKMFSSPTESINTIMSIENIIKERNTSKEGLSAIVM